MPRPHQRIALTAITSADGGRGQAHMACGTGKTLIGRWTAELVSGSLVLVAQPSLQLVAQALAEWRRPASWPFRALVVCSDPTTAAGIAERRGSSAAAVAAAWRASRVIVTTDPAVVADFIDQQHRDHDGLPTVLFSTYHSAPVIASALRATMATPQFDLAVLDEAHRLAGNPSPTFRLVLDDSAIPAARRLFLTATPVITAGRTDPERSRDRPALAMTDRQTFGPVLHRLPFGQAIEEGLLCDYRVLVVGVPTPPAAPTGSRSRAADPLPPPVALAALQDAVIRFRLRRVLSFHTRVANATAFARAACIAPGWPAGLRVWASAVSSATTAGKRQMQLGRLAAAGGDTVGVVASARCLGEGVDVPACDGVLFADPRSSLIDVVQIVGRVLRPAPGKRVGTVIIPVALPADIDDGEALLDTPFAHVWTVLRALRAHDERLAAELDALSRDCGAGRGAKAAGKRQLLGGRVQFYLPGSVPWPAVRLRLVRNTGSSWEHIFGLLEAFATHHGHTRVANSALAADEPLSAWVVRQRAHHRRGLLDPDRARRLSALAGWCWSAAEAAEARTLELLIAHIKRIGSANQPPSGASIYTGARGGNRQALGVWAAARRQQWRRGTLDPATAARLQALPGWDWNPLPSGDLSMVDALARFTTREGHGNPPADHVEHIPPADRTAGSGTCLALGQWVLQMRRRALLGRLHPALKEEILAATPPAANVSRRFTWDVNQARWLLALDALARYAAREQHTNVPPHHIEELDGTPVELGSWCATQRQLRRRGGLTAARVRSLDAQPHWTWNSSATGTGQLSRTATRPRPPHGSPARYDQGCRCPNCTAAHEPYRAAAELGPPAGGTPAGQVSAARARRRLQALTRHRVQPETVAVSCGVPVPRLRQIHDGLIDQIGGGEDAAIAGLDAAALATGKTPRHVAARPHMQHRWRQRYELLARWAKRHGHARPSSGLIVEGIRLGGWVAEQRHRWQRGRMPPERAALLEALPGWAWQASEDGWDAALARLQAFAHTHGHSRVPQQHQTGDGFYLGAWVQRQRSERAAGRLLPARAARLETIPGWCWDTSHLAGFDAGITALKAFARTHGHACPTARYVDPAGFRLGQWVVNHRHRRAALGPGQIARLEAIPGWAWDPFEARWQASYQELATHAAQAGTANPPDGYDDPAAVGGGRPPLGNWIAQQRSEHAHGRLDPRRQQLLEALPGWTWNGYQARAQRAADVRSARPAPAGARLSPRARGDPRRPARPRDPGPTHRDPPSPAGRRPAPGGSGSRASRREMLPAGDEP
jgi:superfamily II DNA or RNA helicase